LTVSVSRRSLTALLALALSTATIVTLLLVLSPRAMAQARSAHCPSSLTAHPKRGSSACAQAGRASRPARKSSAHSRSKAKGHHSKHSKKGKHKAKAKRRAASRAHAPAPALCEDGSAPVNEGGGSFSCADESEPACSNGSAPVLSSNGQKLLCAVKASGSGQAEAVCEDGSAPVPASGGSFSCGDGSMPVCEDGSVPALSSSGSTLVCGPESSDDSSATEVGCEEGTVAVQASDGSYSCVGSSEPGCESAPAPVLSSEHWTSVCDATEGS
jgi:hypothetical protein